MARRRARRARPGEANYHAVDRFSLLHGAVGAVMGSAGAGIGTTMLASVVWETIEPDLKSRYPSVFPNSSLDSPANKVGDMASVALGWVLGRKLR